MTLLRAPYQAALAGVETRLRAAYPDLRPAHFIVFQLIEYPPAGTRLTDLAELRELNAALDLREGRPPRPPRPPPEGAPSDAQPPMA